MGLVRLCVILCVLLTTPAKGSSGVDLSTWDSAKKSTYLDTGWQFYWNRLDSEDDLRTGAILRERPTAETRTGRSWVDIVSDPSMEFGYATYVLQLKGLRAEEGEYGLLFHQFMLNYRAYIYDARASRLTFLAAAGRIGRDKASSEYQMIRTLVPLPALHPESTYLIIQTSRFLLPGVLEDAPELGRYSFMKAHEDRTAWEAFWILGMFFCLFFTNFLLYLLRKEDKPSFFLTLFSVLVMARYFSTEAMYSRLFPEPNVLVFYISICIVGLAFPLGLATYLQFFSLALPKSYPKWSLQFTWVVSLTLSVLLFAVKSYPVLVVVVNYLLATLIIPLAFMAISIRTLVQKRDRNVGILLMGFSVLALALMNDFFVFLQLYSFYFIGHYGMIVFMFTQLIVVSRNFSVAFRTAEKLTRHLQAEVERQTRDVKAILNSVSLGIVSVQGDLIVGDDYSAHLKELLGTEDIRGRSLMDLIFGASNLSAEKCSVMKSVLMGCIGEDRINFELNAENLEHEFVYTDGNGQKRVLSAFWDPVVNEKTGIIEKILLILRDVTWIKEMQERTSLHERDSGILTELLQLTPTKIAKFFASCRRNFEEIEALSSDVRSSILARLHTIKGSARTLGMSLIANAAHEAEESVGRAQDGEALDRLKQVIGLYETLAREKLKWKEGADQIHLTTADAALMIQEMQALESQAPQLRTLGPFQRLRHFVSELMAEDLVTLLTDSMRSLTSLARELEKPLPEHVITPLTVGLTRPMAAALADALVHILRNILDHGIEAPDLRQQKGKKRVGLIRFDLSRDDAAGMLSLTIMDDGQGLALRRIEEAAKAKGLIPQNSTLPAEDLAQIIFAPGFSTRSDVSQISGRGVGMSAVSDVLAKFGAGVRVIVNEAPKDYVPFQLRIDIPAAQLLFPLATPVLAPLKMAE